MAPAGVGLPCGTRTSEILAVNSLEVGRWREQAFMNRVWPVRSWRKSKSCLTCASRSRRWRELGSEQTPPACRPGRGRVGVGLPRADIVRRCFALGRTQHNERVCSMPGRNTEPRGFVDSDVSREVNFHRRYPALHGAGGRRLVGHRGHWGQRWWDGARFGKRVRRSGAGRTSGWNPRGHAR